MSICFCNASNIKIVALELISIDFNIYLEINNSGVMKLTRPFISILIVVYDF